VVVLLASQLVFIQCIDVLLLSKAEKNIVEAYHV
jgi:hypothetical protein